jgi:hypothetical protein
MRTDRSEHAVRLTGKAWEIRHWLRKATKSMPKDARLADWLAAGVRPAGSAGTSRSRLPKLKSGAKAARFSGKEY